MDEIADFAQLVGELCQGSIVELAALPMMGTRDGGLHSVTAKVKARGDSAGTSPRFVAAVEVLSRRVMVVTQTCDLQPQRTRAGRSLVHVAPLIELADSVLRDAQRDSRPNYVPATWLGRNQFADLDQMASIDRGILAVAPRIARPAESERRGLSYRLGRYFSRPALPDDAVLALRPMQTVATAKHSAVRAVLAAIEQIRITPDRGYDQTGPYVLQVTLVVDSDWLPEAEPIAFRETGNELHQIAEPLVTLVSGAVDSDSGKIVTLWARLCRELARRLNDSVDERSNGTVCGVEVDVITSMTPAFLDESDVLDLGHLSLSQDPE